MLLTKIAEWGFSSSLEELDLGKINPNSDESIRCLADILAKAPNLKKCIISNQNHYREVKAEVNYASGWEMGAIVIKE